VYSYIFGRAMELDLGIAKCCFAKCVYVNMRRVPHPVTVHDFILEEQVQCSHVCLLDHLACWPLGPSCLLAHLHLRRSGPVPGQCTSRTRDTLATWITRRGPDRPAPQANDHPLVGNIIRVLDSFHLQFGIQNQSVTCFPERLQP
jgi:hypothetical protein